MGLLSPTVSLSTYATASQIANGIALLHEPERVSCNVLQQKRRTKKYNLAI